MVSKILRPNLGGRLVMQGLPYRMFFLDAIKPQTIDFKSKNSGKVLRLSGFFT